MNPTFTLHRLATNPIIRPAMLPGNDGENINGPSLIRVPPWIDKPLGKYYLYFAHHVGAYIRLAYADALEGPWTVYAPGVLSVEATVCGGEIAQPDWAKQKHLGSPDVHIDEAEQAIKLYFHGRVYVAGDPRQKSSYQQLSFLATSQDGLHFVAQSERLGNSYLRVFQWQGAFYALGMPGIFYRSLDGVHNFVEGPRLFDDNMRHSAVTIKGSTLLVFYTNVGDCPERILLSTIDLRQPWEQWQASEPSTVLEPETAWEGAELPLLPSVRGKVTQPVRQLRDPAFFSEQGQDYLLYAVAGESGIAMAQINW